MDPIALQCLLGLRCNDFAMVAADMTTTQDILMMKSDTNKLHTLSEKLIVGITGDPGDCIQISEYVAKNLALYNIKNGYKPNLAAAVHFTRKTLAEAVHTSNKYNVNMLVAGYDEEDGGRIYYLDALGSCVSVPFTAQGWAGMVALGVMNQFYNPSMTEEDAYMTMQLCVREIHQRWFLNLPSFQVKVINRSGISTYPIICPQTLMQGS